MEFRIFPLSKKRHQNRLDLIRQEHIKRRVDDQIELAMQRLLKRADEKVEAAFKKYLPR